MAFSLVTSEPGRAGTAARGKEESRSGFWVVFFLMTLLSVASGAMLAAHMVQTLQQGQMPNPAQAGSGPALHADGYQTNQRIVKMRPLVTNLDAPGDAWVRVEGVLVLSGAEVDDVDLLTAHVEEDLLAYLHSLRLAQLEGAVGLQHLREDLNERARLRSQGAVSEVILQTLVIQ
ncbi:flagellar basal body-associated FliL family protein [Roseibium aestuarii]|uniref:Flagellar protein FliL n=1 Tax=Roseibium aestuarii TaxID=2600299 RepID=A0ABW4JWH4_9HYPH|nr:flagellar basal body-associated FliL family protein [Roseibium aestuarii]